MLVMISVMLVLGLLLTMAGLSMCPVMKGKVLKVTVALVLLGAGAIVLHAVLPTVIDLFLTTVYGLLGIGA